MKCTVLGSGTWGTALAQVLDDNQEFSKSFAVSHVNEKMNRIYGGITNELTSN